MIAISRFRYDEHAAATATTELTRVLEGLRPCRGFVDGAVARALDDPTLWVVQTRWDSVGSYRRALSSYDVKLTVVPLLARAIDEPSAFEVVIGAGATELNEAKPRGTVA